MTLIATGDVLRNRALQGLEYMSQEEAERERLRQQIKQAESAQKAQLAGTGLGIAGAAGVRYYGDEIKSGLSGIFGGGAGAPALGGDAVLSGGKLLVNASPVAAPSAGAPLTAGQALTAASNPSAVGALASPAGAVGGAGSAGTVVGGAQGAVSTTGGALATGGGTVGGAAAQGAATSAGAGAAGAGTSAGTLSLGAIAAPLAIGIGAYFLLNALFD